MISVDFGSDSEHSSDDESSEAAPPNSEPSEAAPSDDEPSEVAPPDDEPDILQYTVEATGGTSPVISFSEFIVEAEGGKPSREDNIAVPSADIFEYDDGDNDGDAGGVEDSSDDDNDDGDAEGALGGEMDETNEEEIPYEIFRAQPLGSEIPSIADSIVSV